MRSAVLAAVAVSALAGCPASSPNQQPTLDLAVANAPMDLAGGVVRDLAAGPRLEDMAPSVTVVITDDKYTPQEVTISAGQKVRWSFQAAGVHGVFPWDMAVFASSPVMRQGIFEWIFTSPGTYDYGCAIHGAAMPGRVVVR